MNKFALLGEKLSHSYSKNIHQKLFERNHIMASYDLIECKANELESILNKLKTNEYQGFNVTIPFKVEVMKYLDALSDEAVRTGAVNTIIYRDGKLIGYNTDYFGFKNSLNYINIHLKDKKFIILGNGGSARAIRTVLKDLGLNYIILSRKKSDEEEVTNYSYLDSLAQIDFLVNTTPVGMFPNVDESPINKVNIDKCDYIYDLIYNPHKTKLLKQAKKGCNGFKMLILQAKEAEEIWFSKKIDFSWEDFDESFWTNI